MDKSVSSHSSYRMDGGLIFTYRAYLSTTLKALIKRHEILWAVMERRLYKIIITPAMHAAVFLGCLLLFIPGFLQSGYMHIKILCVLLLIMFQFYLRYCHQQLVCGFNKKTSRFFRIINEIPTLLLIIIVLCVIVKPFS